MPKIEDPPKFSKPPGGTTLLAYTNTLGNRISSGDPLIGSPVALNPGIDAAKLVDVDPVCVWSSQIFADSFAVGGLTGSVGVTGRTNGCGLLARLFFQRNVSGAVILAGVAQALWQIVLPTDSLHFRGTSVLAAELKAATLRSNVRGLMVRFVTYHTVYFQGAVFGKNQNQMDWGKIANGYADYAAELKKYEQGKSTRTTPPPPPINHAYSDVIGWIAPWTDVDMQSTPVGRSSSTPPPSPRSVARTRGPSDWPRRVLGRSGDAGDAGDGEPHHPRSRQHDPGI